MSHQPNLTNPLTGMLEQMARDILQRNIRSLARGISYVENELPGHEHLLEVLPVVPDVPVIGITGPPGAGKSTLVDALIGELVKQQKTVAVLCVDPSSPFNMGALLGDRIRMSAWYQDPHVYIRSLATRGSLGGLNPKVLEVTDLLKLASFDYIIVETVGVGQSEIEIAGLADVTVVVMVPEAGDEVQIMKAGLMEIANVFVVNKADREGADLFTRNLRTLLANRVTANAEIVPVIPTVAATRQGVPQLLEAILNYATNGRNRERKIWLLVEKAFQLIQHKRMRDIRKEQLRQGIEAQLEKGAFNLFRYIQQF